MDSKENRDNIIDGVELSDYLFTALVEFGLAPTGDETDLIADLLLDYLYNKGMIELGYIDEDEDDEDPDGGYF